ncbi:Hint domain protein [Pseudosulfitobacter pseudonitzschiae]|uniref:Hint domain protein n=1 Tax=Pseudosulfitobacter pseudonitzschiae TaxID=1402135 RepID=A0A221K0H7_9RHOB|nr:MULTISPECIES: Hint domain-containing protein [Roseobacteraceae]ASM72494.1 Hint domain protein [Pseudosulfitobacter pseudonitzschiae]
MAQQHSWAWVTDRGLAPNSPENLIGYKFQSDPTYSRVIYRDGDENGSVGSTSTGTSHTNDGVAFDGETYNISHHWSYDALITYADGTTLQTQIMVMRLVDDPDNPGVGPSDKKLIFRLHDNAIQKVFEGSDGPGGEDYALDKIASIEITEFISQVNARSTSNALEDDYPMVCFAKGTFIKTLEGEVEVENLKVGDFVLTLDSGYQKLEWIASTKVDAETLKRNPSLYPVTIKKDTIGKGMPGKDLYVSQQHRIYISSQISKNMFGENEILVPAKKLVEYSGVEIDTSLTEVEYYHILLDSHALVFSNGAITESLYLGVETLKTLSSEQISEISLLFPELLPETGLQNSARLVIQKQSFISNLIRRHKKHNRSLVSVEKHHTFNNLGSDFLFQGARS